MLGQAAVSTQGHEIPENIVTPLAPLDLEVALQIFQRAALQAAPSVPLQDELHQALIDLSPELDPLYLPLYSALPEHNPDRFRDKPHGAERSVQAEGKRRGKL